MSVAQLCSQKRKTKKKKASDQKKKIQSVKGGNPTLKKWNIKTIYKKKIITHYLRPEVNIRYLGKKENSSQRKKWKKPRKKKASI